MEYSASRMAVLSAGIDQVESALVTRLVAMDSKDVDDVLDFMKDWEGGPIPPQYVGLIRSCFGLGLGRGCEVLAARYVEDLKDLGEL